jgi:glycerophosphoryl diester phosphodiesterase
MHDKRVDRTTNGRGRVADLEWEELRRFDAGEGQRIPLLEEALEAANGRAGAILECITPGLGEAVWRETVQAGFRGPAIFASFLHREVRAIRELDAGAMTMALLEGVPIAQVAFATEAGATHAGLALDSTTAPFVNALHNVQLQVFVYTADTAEQIDLAIQLGADGIISNFPDRLQKQGS